MPLPVLGNAVTQKVFSTNSVAEEDVSKQLEFIKRRVALKRFAEDNEPELQVSEFMRSEWTSLARYNAKVNPHGYQSALAQHQPRLSS